MSLFLKLFNTTAEYNTYTADTENFILPNVSCALDDLTTVYYNPIETRVVAKYNVTNTSNPTRIGYNSYTSGFSEIEIDGVVQPSVSTGYTFSTTGEHTVKYVLTDPTMIGVSAFYNCSGLTSIEIPSGVTSISDYAFNSCSSLTSIEIPSGVTSIGESAFNKTPWWNTYSADTSHHYGNIIYINDIAYKATSTSITSATFKSGTVSIGNYAFYNCSGLTSIEIPSGVTSIGYSAFGSCSGLTSIVIPSGVTSIGSSTFYGCRSLTSIEIPSGVTSIGSGAFDWCTSLTSIDIPSGVTSIGDSAFNNTPWWNSYSADTSHHYGNVIYINDVAYKATATTITSAELKDSTVGIGSSAFYGCSGLTSIVIPSGVTSIGQGTFYNCRSLTSCTIGSGVTSIGERAFYNCRSLTSIEIPSGVTSIGSSAFEDCTGLTSITIPNSVTSIGRDAFRYCSSLTSITVNATTPPTLDNGAFSSTNNCPIYVPSDSVDSYKSASDWSSYASRIQAIP